MPSREELPDELVSQLMDVGRSASRAEMLGWGVSSADLRRYLRGGLLVRAGRGLYVLPLAATDDHWDRLRSLHLQSAAAHSAPDSVLACRTAAVASGLPVSALPERPELIRPPASSRPTGTITRYRLLKA